MYQSWVVIKGRNEVIKIRNRMWPENENVINEAFIVGRLEGGGREDGFF